jgi:DNA repair protein SbcD/Mre11
MRLVHTADWHLGQSFGPFSRDAEHVRFLAWLLDVLEEERADALFICGDIFETGNPPPLAQRRYYDFLATARRRMPALHVVVIGGNHDAPHRLDAPSPVLEPLGVRVVGAMPMDPSQCVLPLRGPSGDVELVCAAVPFLRMADLPTIPTLTDEDPVIDGVIDVYERVLERAFTAHESAPVVALGHALFAGGLLTDESERPVFGNAHALPVEMFPKELAYVALGHLHRAQALDVAQRVRYSGSPIPLSMTERDYRHQVLVVDVDGRTTTVRERHVPRSVDVLRVPGDDSYAPLDVALDRLRALEVASGDVPEEQRPFLEVRVLLKAPTPDVRARVEEALEGKAVRLLRVRVEHQGDGGALADTARQGVGPAPLGDIEPTRVLEGLYKRTYGGVVPPDIAAAFAELVEQVRVERENEANEAIARQLTLAGMAP